MFIDIFLKSLVQGTVYELKMYKNKTIQGGDSYEEGPRSETKNPWRWEWVDNTVNDKLNESACCGYGKLM